MTAPICLFIYSRPDHLKEAVEKLLLNEEASKSDLFIFSDGPKNDSTLKGVLEARRFAQTITGFKSIKIIEQEKNKGLAESIIDGVSFILNSYDRVIVLEDDILVNKYFLKYMNEALALYENTEQVASIHGYVYPVNSELPETFFIRGADCWGWSTWKRAWKHFNPNGSELRDKLKAEKLISLFNFGETYPYFKMLEDQIAGKNNSWAIRWNASAFLNNMYTLYPGKSLVMNIGHDNSGEHCTSTNQFDVELSNRPVRLKKLEIKQSDIAYETFREYFIKIKPSLISRIINKIKKIIYGK